MGNLGKCCRIKMQTRKAKRVLSELNGKLSNCGRHQLSVQAGGRKFLKPDLFIVFKIVDFCDPIQPLLQHN